MDLLFLYNSDQHLFNQSFNSYGVAHILPRTYPCHWSYCRLL